MPNPPQDPSPTPAPSPSEPASSPGSATASEPARSTRRPNGAGVFVGDGGPAFDPGAAAAAPTPEPPFAEPALIEWEEDTVRSILTAQGAGVHAVVGVADEDWIYVEHELNAIAPPLTRILNRYPATRAAAEGGDAIAVMIGLGGYVSRSYLERRAALAAEQIEHPPEPVTGVPASPGSDGAGDPAQQAARGLGPDWTLGT